MHKIVIIFLLSFVCFNSFAQKSKKDRKEEKRKRINTLIKQEEEGVIAFHKQTAYGVKLVSDGYGGFMEIGRARSVKKALLFQLEIGERKDVKEVKQTNPDFSSIPFVYGKRNFVYDVKLGSQVQFLLGNKTSTNGINVSANFGGGLMLGLLRPYYVQLKNGNNVKYDSPDSSLFLNGAYIAGGSGFGKGWNEMKINPGLYIKAALRFDYGRFNEMINALEVGVNLDLYSKKLQEMVYVKQKQIFVNAYVAIMFGRRK